MHEQATGSVVDNAKVIGTDAGRNAMAGVSLFMIANGQRPRRGRR